MGRSGYSSYRNLIIAIRFPIVGSLLKLCNHRIVILEAAVGCLHSTQYHGSKVLIGVPAWPEGKVGYGDVSYGALDFAGRTPSPY